MTVSSERAAHWAERAAARSPSVRRSRVRSVEHARQIVEAARRLLETKGGAFTTQELIKEAGVALQTFYRYFGGKDELLLAVVEEVIADGCAAMRERAEDLPGPLERLHEYVTGTLAGVSPDLLGPSRFLTAEHYRLHQLFPDELGAASRPFVDLLIPEIEAAADAGLLHPDDVEAGAWFVTQLAMGTFHHYAFVTPDEPIDVVAERLWRFCVRALGGDVS
jgi:AcrR family transcriptional regulator